MMDIYALLKLSPDFVRDFPLQANLVHDSQVEKKVMHSIGRLQRVEEFMNVGTEEIAPRQTIDEVIKRVRKESKAYDSNKEWTSFELRILSYSISQLHGDITAFSYALMLLSNNWRNMYFNGLVSYILNNWNLASELYMYKACEMVKRKLSDYHDNNRKYLALKNHTNFFDANGPMRMAAIMVHKKEPITSAPQLIGYRDTTINLPYYSDVILNYLKLTKCENLDQIEDILKKHTLDRTKKLILAEIVEKADENGTEMDQSAIGHFANRILGDISHPTTWAPFTGATLDEIKRLKNAKELVNKWYVRKVIDVFFDRCVQDPARKRFWMAYVPYIKDFRIAGSKAVRANLENVDRIKDMFENYFISTDSAVSKTAALILMIKNKIFVEFSDSGALYVYNDDERVVSFVYKNQKHIVSTNDLKLTYLPVLVEQMNGYYYFKEEGKVHHSGFWQKRLHSWMVNRMSIVVTGDMYDTFDQMTYHNGDELTFENLFNYNYEDDEEENNQDESVYEEESDELDDQEDFYDDVQYETDITHSVSSKYLFDYSCSVVANNTGFYLYLRNRKKYVFLRKFIYGEKPIPNIWVKKADSQGFQEVVHNYDYRNIVIGYIKQEGNFVLIKDTQRSDTCKKIPLQ